MVNIITIVIQIIFHISKLTAAFLFCKCCNKNVKIIVYDNFRMLCLWALAVCNAN